MLERLKDAAKLLINGDYGAQAYWLLRTYGISHNRAQDIVLEIRRSGR